MKNKVFNPWMASLRGLSCLRRRVSGRRLPLPVPAALAFLALLLVAPALFGYAFAVKLKDGSLLFARVPYTVKGTQAIITLENGTITQIPLAKVDEPGTEKYNRENFGNAIAIPTPRERAIFIPARATRPGSGSSDSRQNVEAPLQGGPIVRGSRQVSRSGGSPSGSSTTSQ
jgi:hypothetical protein